MTTDNSFVFCIEQSSTRLETKWKKAGDKETKDDLGKHTGKQIRSRYGSDNFSVKTREDGESTGDCKDVLKCRRWKTKELTPGALKILGKAQGKMK